MVLEPQTPRPIIYGLQNTNSANNTINNYRHIFALTGPMCTVVIIEQASEGIFLEIHEAISMIPRVQLECFVDIAECVSDKIHLGMFQVI